MAVALYVEDEPVDGPPCTRDPPENDLNHSSDARHGDAHSSAWRGHSLPRPPSKVFDW